VDSVFVPLKESLMNRDYDLVDLFLNLECILSGSGNNGYNKYILHDI